MSALCMAYPSPSLTDCKYPLWDRPISGESVAPVKLQAIKNGRVWNSTTKKNDRKRPAFLTPIKSISGNINCIFILFFYFKLLLIVLCFFPTQILAKEIIKTDYISLSYQSIDEKQANSLLLYADKSYSLATSYLSIIEKKQIFIDVSQHYIFPKYDKKLRVIQIPLNRLAGTADGPGFLRGRGVGVVDLVTNAVAESGNAAWGRFLEKGLGIYLQEKFGDTNDRAYPAMGNDLHEQLCRLVGQIQPFIPLDRTETVRTQEQGLGQARLLAHLQEGSFVRFLIERYGVPQFMAVFDGAGFHEIYGRGITVLEKDWQKTLNGCKGQDQRPRS